MDYAEKFGKSRWTKTHPNNLITHGSTEPVLTVLDVRGFELRDMFLIGLNDDCGSILVPVRERAEAVKAALEPAYAVRITLWDSGDWCADYDRRDLDGSEPSRFITGIVLKDGTVVMKDGRWVR